MARNPRRGQRTPPTLHRGKAQLRPHQEGHRALLDARKPPEEGGSIHGSREASQEINFSITVRRVRIDPDAKRAEYLNQLEEMIRELNELLCNSGTIKSTRLKAMDVMIKALRSCYSIVRDVDIEVIEHEIEELKASAEEPEVDFASLDNPEGPG